MADRGRVWQIASALAIGALTYAGTRYFLPGTEYRTAELACRFDLADAAPPARSAYSSIEVSRVDLSARLTQRDDADATLPWSLEGKATFSGREADISGGVFLREPGTVRAIFLGQDRLGVDGEALRITTLDADGELDWDENTAYVRFASDDAKRSHPFGYRCTVTRD
ncbi:hypothetical protein [Stakelama tenebrarum]|uniref:Uncharacterized protein n=1 Tax=Stakelama tenebrarum TaxID=2711215 RepID=A0A6G6Y3N3_9SPHN|nr:hypothetical protein [Sphingosinithalassobacter tenebrarum]QIG79328.1 hypothetical protein G5C33_05660 [Sphingosinithalassobacter tenebrarum]